MCNGNGSGTSRKLYTLKIVLFLCCFFYSVISNRDGQLISALWSALKWSGRHAEVQSEHPNWGGKVFFWAIQWLWTWHRSWRQTEWLFQELLVCRDCVIPLQSLKRRGSVKRNYPVSGTSLAKRALLMSEVRGQNQEEESEGNDMKALIRVAFLHQRFRLGWSSVVHGSTWLLFYSTLVLVLLLKYSIS